MAEQQKYDQYEIAAKTNYKLWGRILKLAFRKKDPLLLMIFCMIFMAALDAVWPMLTKYAIDNIIVAEDPSRIPGLALFDVAVALLEGLFIYGFVRGGGLVECNMNHDLREECFRHLQELSFSYYDNMPVGHILSRMVGDISRVSELVAWSMVDVVWSSVYILACVTSLFLLNWKLALVVVAVIPLLAVISSVFQKRILRQQRIVRHINSSITSAYNEGVSGAMTSKTLNREEANCAEFGALTSRMRDESVKSAVLSNIFIPLVQFVGNFAVAAVIFYGGGMASVGAIGLGSLAAFISYSGQLFDPVQNLAGIFAELQTAQAAAERVLELLDTPCEISESPEVVEKYGDNFHPKKENWEPVEGEIEFRDVSFKYKNGETVLEHFNLKVMPGESVALVGETGAGKSTIVNLACRFYEPTEGQILIDGKDYRERSSLWLESSLGYVLQTPHLFSGTIADNIRFSRKDASDEEVRQAAATVRADRFIEQFRKGYDTEVGEGGSLLSKGQNQLISFARVVLADPKIIVLDEATSSIDTETEALIQDAIQTVLKGRTSFIVAHRLSTIRNADRILVIDKGRIAEEGDHESLMRKKGIYHRLYTKQFRKEREDASLLEVSV